MSSGFEGKVAIVTGATGGIGAATAGILAERGCRVVVIDLDQAKADRVAVSLPGESLAIACDVADPDSVAAAFQQILDRFGTVDLLHNNAGVFGGVSNFWEADLAEIDREYRVNARGQFIVLQRFVQILVEQNKTGNAVSTASVAGIQGLTNIVGYSMSKHAVVGLVKSAAKELGPRGIRINAICPGRVDTDMAADMKSQTGVGTTGRPIDRAADPREIGYLAAWLLSDEASFITGVAYAVDGGLTA